jgi:hypothetical protein
VPGLPRDLVEHAMADLDRGAGGEEFVVGEPMAEPPAGDRRTPGQGIPALGVLVDPGDDEITRRPPSRITTDRAQVAQPGKAVQRRVPHSARLSRPPEGLRVLQGLAGQAKSAGDDRAAHLGVAGPGIGRAEV